MSHPFVLHNTFGAQFVGLIVASTLHGVSVVQTWYYYGHQNDTWALKALVGAVMTSDTIHQALISHSVYMYTITYWGDPAQLNKIVRTLLVEVLFNGLTALFVQSFLTLRVWRLSNGDVLLTVIAALLSLAEFASVLAYYAMSDGMNVFSELEALKGLSITVNALAAAGDVFIAVVLCTLLHRSRTGFQRSNGMINKLILFAVNTGALTSLCAVASLVSTVFAGNTSIYVGFYFCLGRLYTNSLLATLNARRKIFKNGDNTSATDNLTVSLRDFPKQGGLSTGRGPNISIQINTKKEFVTELNDHDHDMDKTETGSSSAQRFEEKSIV